MEHATDNPLDKDITRRGFLKHALVLSGVAASTAVLTACGGTGTTATAVPTTAQATTAATTAATVGSGMTTTAEATSAASAEATTDATATTGQQATPAIVAATNAFLATLDDTQRTAVRFAYPTGQTVATAAAFGFRVGEQFGDSVWSNYPISDVTRPGLTIGDLSDDQRQAAMAVVAAALSEQGYQKVQHIMHADQLLSEGGTNYASGEDKYVIGIFGTPSESERWMLQFGGHHLGINVTMQGAAMVLAPLLTGCQPSTYTSEGQTIRPLGGETDKAFALINALDATQQAQAILAYAVTDLVLGPGHDGQVLQPEGIPASRLNADQQTMLFELAGEWVNILNDAAAQAKMADIQAHVADTYFAWSGETAVGSSVYFRIIGPTVHIEFANQGALGGGPGGNPSGTPGAGPSGNPSGTPGTDTSVTPSAGGGPGGGQQNPLETGGVNHIHTVYRDPTNEYGTGLS